MPQPSIEERYDPAVAERILGTSMGGLQAYLGIEHVRFEPGRLWCRATVRDEHLAPFGNCHGGVIAGIVDHVTGVVVYPLMTAGQWAATTEVKLNYIAPVQTGVVEAEATVLAMTNRSAVVRGELTYDGKLVCAAQGTLTIVQPRA
jgi:1,4-dihydroxy-2-naphthoyl-CoA hydrolase